MIIILLKIVVAFQVLVAQYNTQEVLSMFHQGRSLIAGPRAHKNGRLEEERVTPIEARSPGKIIEPY